MKVKVYFNLHKKLFSVVDVSTGLVVSHVDEILLTDVTFKVRPGGRAKVLATGVKNVHAFVLGTISDSTFKSTTRVTYNPFRYDSFVVADTGAPIFKTDKALLRVSDLRKGLIFIEDSL